MSEQEYNSLHIDDMSLEEIKNWFGEGHLYRKKQQELIKKRREKEKIAQRQQRNGFLIVLAIVTFFFIAMLDDTSTNSSQEKSCLEEYKEDYQAYLYCARMQNFNR